MNAIEAQADRIRERRTKNVIFAEGHQVAEAVARVAKSRKVREDGTTSRRLLPKVFLHDVVRVDAILAGQFHVKIGRPLVESHVGQRPTRKLVEGSWICRVASSREVGSRNKSDKALNGWRSNGRSFVLGGNPGGSNRKALMLAESFVSQEKEDLVFLDGSAEAGAEIVPLERRLRARGRKIEKVPCIKCIVPEKLKQFAMIIVSAGTSSKVDDRACIPSVLRRKS